VIAIFGTFDIANYGDLLFPLIAARRLADEGEQVMAVAPRGGRPVVDALPSIGVDEFARDATSVRGVLLGGGNIVRASLPSAAYDGGDECLPIAYPSLWLGACLAARARGVPLAWNAPGIAEELPPMAARALRRVAEASVLVSVRDEGSLRRLRATGYEGESVVAPDPGYDVTRLWTAAQLDEAWEDVCRRAGQTVATRTVALHASPHRNGEAPAELALAFDAIAERLDAQPLLLALGPVHGDDRLLAEVAEQMARKPLAVLRPDPLVETTACLAHALAYYGASMHGAITAAAFGHPACLVTPAPEPKFDGVSRELGDRLTRWSDWTEAVAGADPAEMADGALPRAVSDARDEHCAALRSALSADGVVSVPSDAEALSDAEYLPLLAEQAARLIAERASDENERLALAAETSRRAGHVRERDEVLGKKRDQQRRLREELERAQAGAACASPSAGARETFLKQTEGALRSLNVAQARWAPHRFVHIVDAFDRAARAMPLRTVLSVACGRGLPELALAAMHPEVEFTLIDADPRRVEGVRTLMEREGLANVTVAEGDLAGGFERRFDLVIAADVLERRSDDVAAARALSEASRGCVHVLAPFCSPIEAVDEELRDRMRERHGHERAGYTRDALVGLFPGATQLLLRHCYYRDASALRRLTEALGDTLDDALEAELLQLALADLRDEPARGRKDALGVELLVRVPGAQAPQSRG
jgi:hypothetical protein